MAPKEAPPRRGQQAAQVIDENGREQDGQVIQPAAGVEQQAEGQQDEVAGRPEPPGDAEIAQEQGGQEEKQEQNAAEYHGNTF